MLLGLESESDPAKITPHDALAMESVINIYVTGRLKYPETI
jgi:hypothetical protein